MNEVLKTIEDRRSIRAYDPTPIPEADLQAILTAALEAPTARNQQPWHFSVVTNRALLDEFDDALNPEKSVTYKAPAVIFISAPIERSFFAKIDCGIAVDRWPIPNPAMLDGVQERVLERFARWVEGEDAGGCLALQRESLAVQRLMAEAHRQIGY